MTSSNIPPVETKKDEKPMTPFRRWSGLYTVGLILLLLVFFALHQAKRTGFFTARFGPAEMVALYLPILISMAAPILRMVQARTDPARAAEFASDICLAVGSIWLWNHFPFDFAHFADLFPPAMHFAFSWLNDNIGRFILLLQIAIAFLSTLTTITTYLRERSTGGKKGNPNGMIDRT